MKVIENFRDVSFWILGYVETYNKVDNFCEWLKYIRCRVFKCDLRPTGICQNSKGVIFGITYCKRHEDLVYEKIKETKIYQKCKTCGK